MSDEKLAFPSQACSHADRGMSLRDYFAGQALASVPIRNWEGFRSDLEIIEAWARCAYAAADAMLKIRNKDLDPSGKTGA